jgi:ketosteroid isomerase-like protein
MATPEQEHNLRLAGAGLRSWVSGDTEGTLARFTDDIEVYVPDDLGNPGTFRGKKQFLEWTSRWDEAWSEFSYEVVEAVPVGERHVVVTIHVKGQGRGSGIEVEAVQGWVIGVRDELCDYISLQATPDEAAELARRREAAEAGAAE